MPILSKLEGRSARGRAIHAAIFLVLTLGGVTMLYPFAVMVSGSVRSEMDERDLDLVPGFLVDEDVLYRKFLETKYNQDVLRLNRAHVRENFDFKQAALPGRVAEGRRLSEAGSAAEAAALERGMRQEAADFEAFLDEVPMPAHWQVLGGIRGIRTVPENQRALRDRLAERFGGDLGAFARETGIPVASWNTISLAVPDWVSERFDYQPNAVYETYFALLAEAPRAERALVSPTGYFLDLYGDVRREGERGEDAARAFPYEGFTLPRTVPGADDAPARKTWVQFVREDLHPSFVTVASGDAEAFRAMLKEKYGQVEALNRNWGTEVADFGAIELPSGEWLSGTRRKDYEDFLATKPPEAYRLAGPEYAWQDWLAGKYASVEALNAAHGTRHAAFAAVRMPVAQMEYDHVRAEAGRLRWTFATRNFVNVLRELVLRGEAFRNTVIFCGLSIVAALLINPMAAYALSRFQLPGTYKILLLLMATMAFPPMVTMIPQFVMLREMNLLNTFAALVVPFAANGYLIFLLKGFFDSLPKELYEAAALDGASEVRMFFQITMSLSKPILAVVALGAFNGAYMMFLYPLIVCPRQDMWVLSVWLYQWQTGMSTAPVFASVLVACVPTLLVFVFAQKVIMRGIVVPVEK